MRDEDTTKAPTGASQLHTLHLVARACARLESIGYGYAPHNTQTSDACERGLDDGLLSREWSEIDGRDVRVYALTRAGYEWLRAREAEAEAQP